MINTLKINETFVSLQGEGPKTGRLSMFVRLAGCNLTCKLCDSKHSWGGSSETQLIATDSLIDHIMIGNLSTPWNNLVITGGEPMMQVHNLEALLSDLVTSDFMNDFDKTIEIETNGSIINTVDKRNNLYDMVYWNVSPKLASFPQMNNEKTYTYESLRSYMHWNYCFKFVVSPDTIYEDLEEIREIQVKIGIPDSKIYLMPEGTDAKDQAENLKIILNKTFRSGYNYSLRMHIILFGNERGK